MDAPTSGSAANITTPVADDKYPNYSCHLAGDKDNVTHPWPHLQEIVSELQRNARITARLTLCSKMNPDASMGMKKVLTEAMRGIDHITTTTDCWSVRRQSFISVAGFWIVPEI